MGGVNSVTVGLNPDSSFDLYVVQLSLSTSAVKKLLFVGKTVLDRLSVTLLHGTIALG